MDSGTHYRVLFIDTGSQETIHARELMEATLDQTKCGLAKCLVMDDLLPWNQLELWTHDATPLVETMMGKQFDIENAVCYEAEGPYGTDVYTCSIPSVADLLVRHGLGKGKSVKWKRITSHFAFSEGEGRE